MAIALRAAGTWVFAAGNPAVTVPAAQVTGDMMILVAGGKPFNNTFSVPSTWTDMGSAASGTTGSAVDAGSVFLQAWFKEAPDDAEPTTTVTVTGGNVAGGIIYAFSKAAGEQWIDPVAVFGADETTGTALAVTYASDPGGQAGDYVLQACGTNSDAFGPLTTDMSFVWTGITFGTVDAAVEGETMSGQDMSAHAISRPVSSGTSSAAPSTTGTGTASGGSDKIEAVWIRLRVTNKLPHVSVPRSLS